MTESPSASPPGVLLDVGTLTRLLGEHADGVMLLDDAGCVRFLNPAAARILGRDRQDLLDQDFGIPLVAGDRTEIDIPLGGEPLGVCELRVSRSSWEGRPAYLVALRDISEHKRARVEAESARAAAEAADQAKSVFLSRVSHELRTPLTTILGYADLLGGTPLEQQQRDWVDTIARSGRHLLDLINDVLDLARVEQGRMSMTLAAVDVAALLRETVAMLGPLARLRAVELPERLDIPPGCHVVADRQRLRQVLLNLLSNAVKYNRREGRVTAGAVRLPDGRVRILIADTGPGIESGAAERLFIPFERLGADRTPEQGSGLGLTVSKALVEDMNGRLGVDSVPGTGSTFWVELAEATAQATPQEAAPATSDVHSYSAARRILHVEDTKDNADLIRDILVRHRPGIEVESVAEATEALARAREQPPDLVLLDVHLSGVDGDDLLQALRAEPATRTVPVVVLTADAAPAVAARVRAAGADRCIVKPVSVADLLGAIDEVLARGD